MLATPRELYLFGENEQDYGTNQQQSNTQAVIRGCANAHGVCTCYARGQGYRDATLEANCARIRTDLRDAVCLVLRGTFDMLVIPGNGLGTGVAGLQVHAPKTHRFLLSELERAKRLLRATRLSVFLRRLMSDMWPLSGASQSGPDTQSMTD